MTIEERLVKAMEHLQRIRECLDWPDENHWRCNQAIALIYDMANTMPRNLMSYSPRVFTPPKKTIFGVLKRYINGELKD